MNTRTTPVIGSNVSSAENVDSVQSLAAASTSKKTQAEAIRQMPWESFDPQTRQTVKTLIERRSLYRRLPMAGGYCNPEIYDFLLCHPEVVVGLWQKLGYSQIQLDSPEPGRYRLREESGTTALVTVLYHDNQKMVLHCAGVYRGALTAKPLEGETVVLLQYRFTEDKDRNFAPLAITRIDCFIRIKNPGVDLVSRTFGPLIGKIVDSNFVKTVDFVNSVSENAELHPQATAETILSIESVRSETLAELAGITLRSGSLAALRSRGETVDYMMIPKPNQPEVTAARLLSRKGEPSYRTAVPNPAYGAGIPDDLADETARNDEPDMSPLTLESAPSVESAADSSSETGSVRFALVADGSDAAGSPADEAGKDPYTAIPTLKVYRIDTNEELEGARQTVILLDSPIDGIDPLRLYHESVRSSLSVEDEARLLPPGPIHPAFEDVPEPPAETGALWKRPQLQ